MHFDAVMFIIVINLVETKEVALVYENMLKVRRKSSIHSGKNPVSDNDFEKCIPLETTLHLLLYIQYVFLVYGLLYITHKGCQFSNNMNAKHT